MSRPIRYPSGEHGPCVAICNSAARFLFCAKLALLAGFALSAPKPINVGVIGLRSTTMTWQQIETFSRGRARVVAAWDCVAGRLDQVAKEQASTALSHQAGGSDDSAALNSRPQIYRSVTKLAQRPGLDAVVVLDAGWTGLWAARTVAEEGTPVLWFARWPQEDAWDFKGAGRDLIVPALLLRYSPHSLRIRELCQTVLGPIKSLSVRAIEPEAIWEWIDWGRWIVGANIAAFVRTDIGYEVTFGNGCQMLIHVSDAGSSGESVVEVEAQSGHATWLSESAQLSWSKQSGDSAEQCVIDTSNDRNASQVMLDLFLRRVVGGLVPVPSVDDVLRAKERARAVGR